MSDSSRYGHEYPDTHRGVTSRCRHEGRAIEETLDARERDLSRAGQGLADHVEQRSRERQPLRKQCHEKRLNEERKVERAKKKRCLTSRVKGMQETLLVQLYAKRKV